MDTFCEIRAALLLVVVALVAYVFRTASKKGRNFPPGPFAWPVVGNFLEYATDTHLKLAKLKKKYGDVCSGRAGSMDFVILSSAEAVKEAFYKSEFLGKPPYHGFSVFADKSVFFSNDLNLWREQRGFVVRSMRDFGLGKVKMEDEIQDEIRRFLSVLSDPSTTEPFERLLEQSAANNVLAMIIGRRFQYGDPVLLAMLQCIREYASNVARGGLYFTFPWIRHLSPLLRWWPGLMDYDSSGYEKTKQNFKELIEEHKKTFNAGNSRDFIDTYLQEIHKNESNSKFTEDILLVTSMELIGAGTDTTTSCILWCLYALGAEGALKERLLREIEGAVGMGRAPSLADQKLMPYTQAFILEILRWASIVPIAPLRYTTQETSLRGFDIPKDTAVLANFWAVHHDPETWGDPEVIRPERFLRPDGSVDTKHSGYMQFSVGKRKCPGEAMAYMEIFLFVVSILQKFDVNFLPGAVPTFESEIVVLSRPKHFPIRMTSRTDSVNITLA